MEKGETPEYQVEFTPSSRYYFYEVLEYLYEHYPIDRAEQLADELESLAQSLIYHPRRGAKESGYQVWSRIIDLSFLPAQKEQKSRSFIMFRRVKEGFT